MNFLRPELYKLVGLLEVRSRKWILGNRMGGGNFRGKGRGMEFRDVREYSTGDDIRFMDWNVTSRTGELHVKEFYQERDIPVIILLDLSYSMVSQKSKADLGFQLAIFLALIHLKSGNRSSIVGYSEDFDFQSGLIRNQPDLWRQARRLQDAMNLSNEKKRKTNHSLPLKYLQNNQIMRSLVYVLSDFANYPLMNEWRSILKRHEAHAFFLGDPIGDENLKELASYFCFTESESNSLTGVYETTEFRDQERLKQLFHRNFHRIQPNQDWMSQLFKILGPGV